MKKYAIILGIFVFSFALVSVAFAAGGFNEFGYNYDARIFNGTGESWSLAKGLPANYLGIYAKDKLVMKWNAEWDRGNAEGWSNPPYAAWENNEWNGKVKGGSGEIWHYKIAWDAGCAKDGKPSTQAVKGTPYCLWGPFSMLMSQGTVGNEHIWDVLLKPAGYGAY